MNSNLSVAEYEDHVINLFPKISDHETRVAVIILAAVYRGTPTAAMTTWTGYPRDLVREVSLRMRNGRNWYGGKAKLFGTEREYLTEMIDYVMSEGVTLPKEPKKPKPCAIPDRYNYLGSHAPLSVSRLRSIHDDINTYDRPSASSYGKPVQKRVITDDEWEGISASIDANGLAVVMRSSSFGFKLGVDIIRPPSYPGAPVDYIMAINQDAIPYSLLSRSPRDSNHSDGCSPVSEWNDTWDIFSKWTFTCKNIESVGLSNIKMPVRKSAYTY